MGRHHAPETPQNDQDLQDYRRRGRQTALEVDPLTYAHAIERLYRYVREARSIAGRRWFIDLDRQLRSDIESSMRDLAGIRIETAATPAVLRVVYLEATAITEVRVALLGSVLDGGAARRADWDQAHRTLRTLHGLATRMRIPSRLRAPLPPVPTARHRRDRRTLPGLLTRQLTAIAVQQLPRPHQPRFLEEWLAESLDLSRREQLAHALNLVVRARATRDALDWCPKDGLSKQSPWQER